MDILLLTFAGCVLLLFIIFLIVWHKTDWKKIDEANKRYINEDGDHIYYDRHIIEQKKRKKTN